MKGRGSIPFSVNLITGPAIPQIAAVRRRYVYARRRCGFIFNCRKWYELFMKKKTSYILQATGYFSLIYLPNLLALYLPAYQFLGPLKSQNSFPPPRVRLQQAT